MATYLQVFSHFVSTMKTDSDNTVVNKGKDIEVSSGTVVTTDADKTLKEPINSPEPKPSSDGTPKPSPSDAPPRKRRKLDSEMNPASAIENSQPSDSILDSSGLEKLGSADIPLKNEASEGKYALGSRLEARDLSTGKWYNVKVVEVDLDDREVLIHFEKWSQRFDEWIPMDSSRLREIQHKSQSKTSGCGYRVGETVMATWTDSRKYPAKVKTIFGGDKIEVLFFDGFSKTMKVNKIAKFDGDLEVQPEKPAFGAATMTKAERRERNRKILSVAELFHMKKSYKKRSKDDVGKEPTESPDVERIAVLSETKPLTEQDVLLSESEGEKMYIDLDSSLTQDEGETAATEAIKKTAATKRSKQVGEEKGKKRKRTYNRVFLDSSPAGTVREVHPGRGRVQNDGTVEDLDNWEPDGDDAYVVETSDGLRRSIIVADERLPAGWEKHTIQRRSGNSAGKWDVFLVSPSGRRFRSRKEMAAYFTETKELYEPHLYDFTLRSLSHRSLKSKPKSSPAQSSAESDAAKPELVETPQRKSKSAGAAGNKAALGSKASSGNKAAGQVAETQRFPLQPAFEVEKLPTPDEGKVYVGQMQVQVDTDGAFICPKDGCLKHFRRENLLQMHIKHYHPEYNKFMGSTPNVADLAYARTMGESIEDVVPCGRALDSAFFENITRFEANRKSTPPQLLSPAPPVPAPVPLLLAPTSQKKEEAAMDTRKVLKLGQTSSILTDALKGRETESTQPAQLPPASLPKVAVSSPLRDLLREHPKPGVTAGIKTLLPVVRSLSKLGVDSAEEGRSGKQKVRKRRLSDAYMESLKRKKLGKRPAEASGELQSPSEAEPPIYVRPHKKLPLLAASLARPPLLPSQFSVSQLGSEPPASRAPDMTQEQLNKRDIINCTCGVMEEDGLMIQCDLCLCWQHGYCNAIESERQVPEKYVCAICLRPARARPSLRHRHDQTWLKEGTLPTAAALHSRNANDGAQHSSMQRSSLLRKSHALTGELLGVKTVLRSLRAKVNIADASDHPKLYLWAKPWTKHTLDLVRDKPVIEVKLEVKPEEESEVKMGEDTKQATECEDKLLPANVADSVGGTKLLLQALTGANSAGASTVLDEKQLFDLPICQSELLRFASSMADNLDNAGASARAPEPEKPIDLGECRTSLLDHIEHDQRQLMRSLDLIAQQISALETEDPEPPPQESVEFCPRMKHTVKMLLRDLTTMHSIATL